MKPSAIKLEGFILKFFRRTKIIHKIYRLYYLLKSYIKLDSIYPFDQKFLC